MKKNEKWIKICPRCGSKDIRGGPLYGLGVFPKPYKCLNCGFIGYLFPEIISKKFKVKTN